jgi:Cdc6-like AAA superfamily ATPase
MVESENEKESEGGRTLPYLQWEEIEQLKLRAAELFSPRTPITTQELFAGRSEQISKLNNTIGESGAHAIIYGERGAGKTSLANIAPIAFHVYNKIPHESIVSTRVNCDSTDTYDSIWRKVFRSIYVTKETTPMGLLAQPEVEVFSLLGRLDVGEFTPGEVQQVLSQLARDCHIVVTLDEFDRLPCGTITKLVADTIKSLSDSSIRATIVIVGVGESVASLVQGHESVGRHLVEVPLQRMSRGELEKILTDRLPLLNDMKIEEGARRFISLVSSGLPYFTHLLGQHAAKSAINDRNQTIRRTNVDMAMKSAIADSEREMKESYYSATRSPQSSSTFHVTLAACALATHDDFGYFTAANIRDALGSIKGDLPAMGSFTPHLERFCSKDYGNVLQQGGLKHQRRYRFENPLMQPFVIIRSLDDGVISVENIKTLTQ